MPGTTTAHYDDLTPTQLRALELLLSGHKLVQVAQQVGVTDRSLRRWLAQDPFRLAYRRGRADLWTHTTTTLHTSTEEAVATLRALLTDAEAKPAVRLAAARSILTLAAQSAKLDDLEERVRVTEERDRQYYERRVDEFVAARLEQALLHHREQWEAEQVAASTPGPSPKNPDTTGLAPAPVTDSPAPAAATPAAETARVATAPGEQMPAATEPAHDSVPAGGHEESASESAVSPQNRGGYPRSGWRGASGRATASRDAAASGHEGSAPESALSPQRVPAERVVGAGGALPGVGAAAPGTAEAGTAPEADTTGLAPCDEPPAAPPVPNPEPPPVAHGETHFAPAYGGSTPLFSGSSEAAGPLRSDPGAWFR